MFCFCSLFVRRATPAIIIVWIVAVCSNYYNITLFANASTTCQVIRLTSSRRNFSLAHSVFVFLCVCVYEFVFVLLILSLEPIKMRSIPTFCCVFCLFCACSCIVTLIKFNVFHSFSSVTSFRSCSVQMCADIGSRHTEQTIIIIVSLTCEWNNAIWLVCAFLSQILSLPERQ